MCKMYNFTKLKQRCKCGKFIKKEENERRNCANKTNVHYSFTICMYFVHKYLILYNQFERTYTEDVVMTPLHIKFFHNNRPGSYCRGTPRLGRIYMPLARLQEVFYVIGNYSVMFLLHKKTLREDATRCMRNTLKDFICN